jgi:hypothetical protein
MSRLLLLLTQDPMIAGTADVIVIEDSFPNDVGSSDPDDSIIPSTSDMAQQHQKKKQFSPSHLTTQPLSTVRLSKRCPVT